MMLSVLLMISVCTNIYLYRHLVGYQQLWIDQIYSTAAIEQALIQVLDDISLQNMKKNINNSDRENRVLAKEVNLNEHNSDLANTPYDRFALRIDDLALVIHDTLLLFKDDNFAGSSHTKLAKNINISSNR